MKLVSVEPVVSAANMPKSSQPNSQRFSHCFLPDNKEEEQDHTFVYHSRYFTMLMNA